MYILRDFILACSSEYRHQYLYRKTLKENFQVARRIYRETKVAVLKMHWKRISNAPCVYPTANGLVNFFLFLSLFPFFSFYSHFFFFNYYTVVFFPHLRKTQLVFCLCLFWWILLVFLKVFSNLHIVISSQQMQITGLCADAAFHWTPRANIQTCKCLKWLIKTRNREGKWEKNYVPLSPFVCWWWVDEILVAKHEIMDRKGKSTYSWEEVSIPFTGGRKCLKKPALHRKSCRL